MKEINHISSEYEKDISKKVIANLKSWIEKTSIRMRHYDILDFNFQLPSNTNYGYDIEAVEAASKYLLLDSENKLFTPTPEDYQELVILDGHDFLINRCNKLFIPTLEDYEELFTLDENSLIDRLKIESSKLQEMNNRIYSYEPYILAHLLPRLETQDLGTGRLKRFSRFKDKFMPIYTIFRIKLYMSLVLIINGMYDHLHDRTSQKIKFSFSLVEFLEVIKDNILHYLKRVGIFANNIQSNSIRLCIKDYNKISNVK